MSTRSAKPSKAPVTGQGGKKQGSAKPSSPPPSNKSGGKK